MAYAVIQLGYAVYGVGETEEAAEQDARQWLDDGLDDDLEIGGPPNRSSVEGDICLVECTQALMLKVQTDGGDIRYDINDEGKACLPEEINN